MSLYEYTAQDVLDYAERHVRGMAASASRGGPEVNERIREAFGAQQLLDALNRHFGEQTSAE